MTRLFAKLDLGANVVVHLLGAPDSFEPELAPLGRAGFRPVRPVRPVAIDEDGSALRFRRVEYIASPKRHPDGALTAAGRAKAAAQRGR